MISITPRVTAAMCVVHPCHHIIVESLLSAICLGSCFAWCEGYEQILLHSTGTKFTFCTRHENVKREQQCQMHAAGSCTQNNTCGGGAFPELMGFQCKGFNPEGQDLGTAGRCASNAYDNMGYLTLDFTCATSVCKVDGDCPVVSMNASGLILGGQARESAAIARKIQTPKFTLPYHHDAFSRLPARQNPL